MEIPYSPHVSRYFGFLDPSGGRHDAFTLAIAHQNYGSDNIVLDLIRATRSPFDPSEVVKDYSDVLKAYRLSSALAITTAENGPRRSLPSTASPMSCARRPNQNCIWPLFRVFTSKRLELLDIEKMKTEFRRLERRRGRSGKDTIDHPPRGSDDMANAVAGAIWLVSEHGGQFFRAGSIWGAGFEQMELPGRNERSSGDRTVLVRSNQSTNANRRI